MTGRMPPVNRDSSDLTRKRKAMTLYGWYSANKDAGTIYREQANTQTLDITTQRQLGACYCSQTQGTYDFVGSGCGCRN